MVLGIEGGPGGLKSGEALDEGVAVGLFGAHGDLLGFGFSAGRYRPPRPDTGDNTQPLCVCQVLFANSLRINFKGPPMPKKPYSDNDPERGARFVELEKALFLRKKRTGIAEIMGYGESTLRSWEVGHPIPSSGLSKLASYGVNLNWLLTGDGRMGSDLPGAHRILGKFGTPAPDLLGSRRYSLGDDANTDISQSMVNEGEPVGDSSEDPRDMALSLQRERATVDREREIADEARERANKAEARAERAEAKVSELEAALKKTSTSAAGRKGRSARA